ncbi:hypothetical protein [Lyngbya aestuarii]|uniref:hypothetical protein n=1 Tax=Lyngbya aestuarii TaxID=118322 RepID=UPI00403DF619
MKSVITRMNEYLRAFQEINQSVERLLINEHNSPEIKHSAKSLRQSIQPCLEELEEAANRLKRLVTQCSDELYLAEDVWLSKPRISQAAKLEIWEQIGEISGCLVKIDDLGRLCKKVAIKQAQNDWETRLNLVTRKWFIDSGGKQKKGIGWQEKEGFIKDIHPSVEHQVRETNQIIENALATIYGKLTTVDIEKIQYYSNLLSQQEKAEVAKQLDLMIRKIETNFNQFTENLPNGLLRLSTAVKPDVKTLVDNGWGDIYWKDVVEFKHKINLKIFYYVTAIFDDRMKLVTQAIEQAIAFYNDFLERQERYQQETPEQRVAEKAWIDQQRHQLNHIQLQLDIETIFNPN